MRCASDSGAAASRAVRKASAARERGCGRWAGAQSSSIASCTCRAVVSSRVALFSARTPARA
ncbi:hypothetical protein A5N15_10730 [Rothia kristinae]|uniref:Uncharacterized protein n=1 Tax=Rothia kristinae TaxID=37923 RepID=A0A657ITM3_9MICC|nr:hypothetical protein A5N15_10730 [Rothia kristinae]